MSRRMGMAVGLLSIALTAGLAAGCSSGAATSNATGEVSLAITDAPLSQLASLEIEITTIQLKGAGVADYTVFAASAAAPAMTVDLLSLQGLNQVLSNASVPVGTYHSVKLTYQHPTATDNAGNPVTVNHSGDTLLGLFAPPLRVATTAAQAVQIDVDLRHSVIDTGPDEVFLAPAVIARVLGQTQSIPIQRLHGVVVGTDVANDRFVMAIRRNGGAQPGHGQIRVQCSTSTTFTDATGNTTTGNVTAQLRRGDLVDVDGVLRGGVIDADHVTGLGQPNPGPAPWPHPITQIAGTLANVDVANQKVSVIVDRAFGSAAPTRFTKIDLDVAAGARVFRGRTALAGIGDLVLGNYTHVLAASLAAGGFEARAIDEGPSRIAGTIDRIDAGNGANGADRVTFIWSHLNQIAAGNPLLPTLPAAVDVDLPAPFQGAVGDPIHVVAFFESGTTLLTLPVYPGPVPPPPAPGPIGPPFMHLAGTVNATTPPGTNGSGDIEFDLDLPTQHGTVHVTVDQNAALVQIDSGGQRTQLTVAGAVAALQASPRLVEVEGSRPPVRSTGTATFTADLALRIFP